MKKIVIMVLISIIILGQSPQLFAINENSNIPVEEVEEQKEITLDIQIDKSLFDYFSNSSQTFDSIENLKITTINNYNLSVEDLEYINNNFPNLKTLDLDNASFDSEETKSIYIQRFKDIIYNNDISQNQENNTEISEETSNETGADIVEDNSNIDNITYDLKLNGICLLDKGNLFEVGVAYETNDPNIEFRWLEYDLSTSTWKIVSDWNKGNWTNWRLTKPGDYWIYVEARTSDGNVKSSVYGHHYNGIQVKLSGICILDRKTYFDIGVAYETNDPGLMFQWKLYDIQNNTWHLIKEKTKGNWISWSPVKAGDYWIHVEAIDSNGEVHSTTTGFHFFGFNLSLNGICLIEKENQVDMGVAYETNDSEINFQWKIYDLKNEKWSLLSGWNSGNWASWKPEKAGDYWLYVEAKTRDNQIKSQVMGYRVDGPKITSFEVDPSSPGWLDSNIILSGTYKDLTNQVGFFRYLVYDGIQWNELKVEDGNAIWKPSKLGDYLICFEIYDKNNKLIEQSFKGYSIEEPYVDLKNFSIRQIGELSFSVTINSETNDKNILYKWMYYNPSTQQWHNITDWTSNKTVRWTLPAEGYYWIHVEAKIHNGVVESYTEGYTAQKYAYEISKMLEKANNYSSRTQYIILVNRSTHNVGIFNGSRGSWSLDKYWPCSDGKPSTPTVEGVFTVKAKGYYFDSGNSRCYWYTQFYGDYLFHSVLYNKDGTLQDGRLGMALSHGCVRLQIENAKWIYDNIPSGTTVVVY